MELIEEVVQFWDKRPCNLKHSSKEIGSKEYFKEVSERRYFVEPHIKSFVNFPEWKGKKVLEIGCGIGTDAHEFVKNGAIYTGTDISQSSIDIARKRFSTFNLQGEFVHCDVESLSKAITLNDFDLIYSFGVIHHTPSIENALSEIAKIAKTKTLIKIMIYARYSWKQALMNAGLDQPEAQFGCPVANTYSKEDANKLFKNAGLQIKNISQDHIFPYSIKEYKNYEYVLEPHFASMSKEVFSALKSQLGWHLLIDAKNIKQT